MNVETGLEISRAIKENKWLSINYRNQNNQKTAYWIAIKDINMRQKTFNVDAFNLSKLTQTNRGLISTNIYFDNIETATLLDNTTHEPSHQLIEKIENNLQSLEWLQYDSYSDQLLDYIKDCMIYESIPYQTDVQMVSGIDADVLFDHPKKVFDLSYKQMGELTDAIRSIDRHIQRNKGTQIQLAMNRCSISTPKGLFVIAYHQLLLNPMTQQLVLDPKIFFNSQLQSNHNNQRDIFNLYNYLDYQTDTFFDMFISDEEKAKNLLSRQLLSDKESIDDRPYLMELKKHNIHPIIKEINAIKSSHRNKSLHTPMKAFFGNMNLSLLRGRKRESNIVVLNNNLNVDQFRVINNALKQPITYVQGPPGTGKTQSIVNLVVAAYFNKQTTLISSNNNKPIDDIGLKLQIKTSEGYFRLPFLRLGNTEKVKETLKEVKQLYEKYKDFSFDSKWLKMSEDKNKEAMAKLKKAIEQYEEYLELEEQLHALETMKNEKELGFRAHIIIEDQLTTIRKQLSDKQRINDEDIQKLVLSLDEKLMNWIYVSTISRIQRLKRKEFSDLIKILDMTQEDQKVIDFNQYISEDENLKKLLNIFPVILTTNHSVYRLGSANQHFDMTIVDEASQCTMGYSLFAMMRGKRLLLVGDLNQLQPVVTIPDQINSNFLNKYHIDDNFSYKTNSILSLLQKRDTISKFILLRFHYRSDPKIINFSNRKYYKNQLIVKSKFRENQSLQLIDIDSSKQHRSNNRNISYIEASAIIEDIKKNNFDNVGIITPYRNQAEIIKQLLISEKISGVDVGTVHTFQGDEKNHIYLSCAITSQTTEGSFNWMKNNQELINVAATRAKDKLSVVGDVSQIKRRSPDKSDILELINYAGSHGQYNQLSPVKTHEFINGHSYKQFNSVKEKEFLATINQILSLNVTYKVETQVKVSSVLDRFTKPELFYYGNMAVFDLVVYEKRGRDLYPILVIEFDGQEHHQDSIVQSRDEKKAQICRDNHIKLLRIPNDYSRRYMYLKEILTTILASS